MPILSGYYRPKEINYRSYDTLLRCFQGSEGHELGAGGVEEPLPWFFSFGSVRPVPETSPGARVWPDQVRTDRIREQLMLTASTDPSVMKSIYVDRSDFSVPLGSSFFVDSQCPVDRCTFVSFHDSADAVLFKDRVNMYRRDVPQSQVCEFYSLITVGLRFIGRMI